MAALFRRSKFAAVTLRIYPFSKMVQRIPGVPELFVDSLIHGVLGHCLVDVSLRLLVVKRPIRICSLELPR
jgi:hypothetical protein